MILRGISSPVQGGDAVNKDYVDELISDVGNKKYLLETDGYHWYGNFVANNTGLLLASPLFISGRSIAYQFVGEMTGSEMTFDWSFITNCPTGKLSVSIDKSSITDISTHSVERNGVSIVNNGTSFSINPNKSGTLCVWGVFIVTYQR